MIYINQSIQTSHEDQIIKDSRKNFLFLKAFVIQSSQTICVHFDTHLLAKKTEADLGFIYLLHYELICIPEIAIEENRFYKKT